VLDLSCRAIFANRGAAMVHILIFNGCIGSRSQYAHFYFMKLLDFWMPLNGYEQYYLISYATQQVKNKTTGELKKFHIDKDGYLRMNVPPKSCKRLHRLVAQTFVANPLNKPEVDHIDTIKTNNHPSNLQWVTKQEHKRHSKERGQIAHKLSIGDVEFIRSYFWLYGKEFLANKYGITTTGVYNIATGRARKDVGYPVHHKRIGVTKIILDINTGVFYESADELAALLGTRRKYVHRWLNGEGGRPNPTSYRYV